MKTYQGLCHCGDVRFSIESDLAEFTTCDCSLCEMRGAVMVKVPEGHLTLLSSQDALGLYQWNMRIARHFFCKRCGIYVFHNKRAAPDHFGVNVRCLIEVGPGDAPIRATDGKDMTVSKDGSPQTFWPGPRI